jgi:hypothetical protein
VLKEIFGGEVEVQQEDGENFNGFRRRRLVVHVGGFVEMKIKKKIFLKF